ncbi:MAG: class I SAM-dependent methyltransferase [Ferrovibrionaceae bacterium]
MSHDPVRALFLPLGDGFVAWPEDHRALFLGAVPDAALEPAWADRLTCVQPLKPAHDRLAAQGFAVAPERRDTAALVFVLLGKQKHENLGLIADGFAALRPGGRLVIAGANEIGAARYEKMVAALVPLEGSLFRFHARAFWVAKPAAEPADLAAWRAEAAPRRIVDGRWVSQPGLFAWDRVDPGSAMLTEHFPPRIGGTVADLGAGWGYLSATLIERYPDIAAIDLYEADARSLACARANLGADGRASFHWADVTAGLPARHYDWIVSNPPFHEGRGQRVDLGQGFIAAASAALKPGGRFLLVANRQLPYEATLSRHFASHQMLADGRGYKVIAASAPKSPSR